jgi:type I restriction enzyme S subunit
MTGRYKAYAEYKDSGVEWFEYIPKNWSVSRLKFSSLINMGQSPNSDDCNTDGIGLAFLQGNAEFGKKHPTEKQFCPVSKKIAKVGELLFSVRAPVGALNIADKDYGIGRGLCSIKNKLNVDPQFLWWVLPAYKKQFDAVSTGSTFEAVSAEQVGNLAFGLPSFEEQQKIANFLDHETAKIDTLIAKQEKLIELLKEKRQAVISHAVTKGLNPDAPMKDSGVEWLGEVPEHWDVMKFSYAIDFLEGPGILAVDFHDEGIPLLRIQNVKESFVTDNFKTYLNPVKVKERWDHFRVEKGDLLISASASTGLIAEVDERTVGAIPYTGLIRLKPMTQDITTDFIRYIVQSDLFYEQIKLLQTGSTIQHFGPIHLQQMKVLLPPVDEQNRIVGEILQSIKHIDSLIENAGKVIDLTKERKTALISAAVTGKIDVRDWESK